MGNQAKSPLSILITGATSGIGRRAALDLARRGHTVFATGRSQRALDALQTEAKGLPLTALRLDVCDETSMDDALAQIRSNQTRSNQTRSNQGGATADGCALDVLINNAGYGQMGPVELVDLEQLRAQFETNVFGLIRLTQAVIPGMRARGRGRIINVSSVGGRVTFPLMGVYNSSKYALESLSDALRAELAGFGIRVVLIEPGPIRTEFTERGLHTAEAMRHEAGPYSSALAKADETAARFEKFSAEASVVSRAIVRAVESSRPAARYVAPRSSALLIVAARLLPTSLLDWAMRKLSGLDMVAPPASAATTTDDQHRSAA